MVNPQASAARVGRGVHVDVDACLARRPASVECNACVEACPADALRWSDDGVSVEGGCLDCGRCAAACPAGAIRVGGFELPRFEAADTPGELWIECARVPARWRRAGAVVVPCLGGVTAQQLLDLAARGTAPVLVDRGWCGACPAGGARAAGLSEYVAEAACDLAAATGSDADARAVPRPRVEPSPLPPAVAAAYPAEAAPAGAPLGRRGFFAALRGGAPSIVAATRRPRQTRSRAACRPSDTIRAHLSERASALDAAARRAGVALGAQAFPAVAAHDNCCHEGVCAAGCPSGALPVAEDEDAAAVGLDFDATLCLACGLCAQLCPHGALSVASAGLPGLPIAPGAVALSRHPLRHCGRCGDSFVAQDAMTLQCPRCAMARDQAFDLFGPRPEGRRHHDTLQASDNPRR